MSDLTVSPPEPAAFLRALILLTEHRAETLRAGHHRSHCRRICRIETYLTDVITHSHHVSDELDDREFGSFGVMLPLLNTLLHVQNQFAARDDSVRI